MGYNGIIKIGGCFGVLPKGGVLMTLRELLKQNELHFPLMRIPYHTSLSEISEAVSKYVYGINEEHNTRLLYTLETYFNNCQNSVKTSKALFIHRNTLLYRLDRIAEILDLNYNDSEQMLTFQLALKAFLMCQ